MRDADGSRLDRARELRRNTTVAEGRLWEQLRAKRFNGVKFVRQHPVGPYFADFASRSHKFVVEVDSATHSSDAELQHDAACTAYLRENGYRVLRVSNDEVLNAMDQVLVLIAETLDQG